MYSYFKGSIKEIEGDHIVIEVNNIGYKVFVSNPYSYNIDESIIVYLYNHIREDEYSLYGFISTVEREMFLKLINVKGMGPKTALGLLATGSINGLIDAINKENILYLKKFPKVGEKLARQIVLDLKGKMESKDNLYETDETEELISVLENLGYSKNDIKRVIPNIDKSNTLEVQVKEALKLMLK
jgi:holliday junction DNA helicase RuvA